ncbi:MAG: hypothetical protein LUE24_03210 [Lachnospiraceae bacterium]|nr:hypothetical protein [Lachnospiraceae bacterium]
MVKLLNTWKKTAMEHPRLCMLASWIVMWVAGTLLKIPTVVTALIILTVGYPGQFIWMMRVSRLSEN